MNSINYYTLGLPSITWFIVIIPFILTAVVPLILALSFTREKKGGKKKYE